MKASIDLHMHSLHSDGTDEPSELMRRCAKKKLKIVSLTDHDTISSYAEAKKAADEEEIELIPGIEISVGFNPGSLHILGYFFNPDDEKFNRAVAHLQDSRNERNLKIVELLKGLGIEIEFEEVERAAGLSARDQKTQVGRPHFAKVLVEKGHVKSSEEAFRKYLAKGAPAYANKWRLSSKEAIEIIRDAGGVASVAHPTSLKLEDVELEEAIGKMANEGLGALEVYHSSHKPRVRNELLHIANKFDLIATGGSDYHGKNKPKLEVGFLGRGVQLDEDIVTDLRNKSTKG